MTEVIKWPGMRYGPNNTYCIFEGPDEVPEGWTDNPNRQKGFKPLAPMIKVAAAVPPAELIPASEDLAPPLSPDGPAVVTEEQIKEMEEKFLNRDMVAMLELMQAEDDNIEFSAKWPGAKLARCILENGGVPEGFSGDTA